MFNLYSQDGIVINAQEEGGIVLLHIPKIGDVSKNKVDKLVSAFAIALNSLEDMGVKKAYAAVDLGKRLPKMLGGLLLGTEVVLGQQLEVYRWEL
jgi:hypothetical protein